MTKATNAKTETDRGKDARLVVAAPRLLQSTPGPAPAPGSAVGSPRRSELEERGTELAAVRESLAARDAELATAQVPTGVPAHQLCAERVSNQC